MIDLSQKIRAEIENIEQTLSELEPVLEVQNKEFPELAALAIILHNFYSGIENILKQILKEKKFQPQKAENWHKALLESSEECRIIPEDLKLMLYEYLIFRHYFVHGYAIHLRETPLKSLVDNLNVVWERFLQAIQPYYVE